MVHIKYKDNDQQCTNRKQRPLPCKSITQFKNQNICTLVKSQYHVNSSTADGTTTSLMEHFVSARLTETLVATWHQRDACVTLSHEADLATVVVDICCVLCSCAGICTNCCWL